MKNLKNIIGALLFLAIISCAGKQENTVKPTTVQVEKITDSLYSRLPGSFLLLKDFIVWQDVFGRDGFLHILSRENRNEVLKLGKIGQGPSEFSIPEISYRDANSVFIYDANTGKQAILDLSKKQKEFEFIASAKEKYTNRKLYLDSSLIVSSIPDSVKFIKTVVNGKVDYLNCWIQDEITNRFDVFQGSIFTYNKEKIVYSASNFPYVAIYEKDKSGKFALKQEIKKEAKYRITDKKLKIEPNSLAGAFDATLSKDYIVLLQFQKDNTKKRKNSIGGDSSKLPKTLFLYSYEGKLKKIIDLKMPILRITSNPDTNELFFIGISPEFTIYKCNL